MRSIFHTQAQPPHTQLPMTPTFRLGAVASALALVLGLTAFLPSAHALSLGKLTVQSALGEPLRAEIDIPELTPAEASSLRIGLAGADVYRAAGVDFNATLANTNITIARRPNGQAYVRIGNNRAVNEPYLDLILEASWASGRIVRDYTMLFDPPNLRVPQPPQPAPPLSPSVTALPIARTAPLETPAALAPAALNAPGQPNPAPQASNTTPPAPATSPPARPAAAPRAATPTPTPPAAPRAAVRAAPERQLAAAEAVTVKRGDTAGRIAGANKPASATLEQMLVAMLRANPDAFIGDNVNRLKAGAVLDLPDDAQAQAVPAEQARRLIVAQSRDFNTFRQRLAAAAPTTATPSASRVASGSVRADIADQRPAASAPDQLKLSKGAVATGGAALPEQKIAQAKQTQALNERTAELNRNINELAQLGVAVPANGAAPASPAPTAATAPATASAVAVGTPAAATSAAPAEPTSAPATAKTEPPATEGTPPDTATPTSEPTEPATPTPAADPTTTAPAAEAAPPAAPAPPAEPPVATEEPSLLDTVLDNPLALPAAGGLLALLLGLGFYRLRQRKKLSGVDSSFLESRLQPDSFFGASGGQNIDTAEAAPTGSSMMYSHSQLDVGGDVDPVAEADVYLAYGRDLQAEEILKEAMRVTPTRVAIHVKLLEIYAKRRDVKGFEVMACEVYALTQGTGAEWTHACELGLTLDPANPLYQPGGTPAQLNAAVTQVQDSTPGMANTQPFEPSDLDNALMAGESAPAMDLDLDFSIDAAQALPATNAQAFNPPAEAADTDDHVLNFDLDLPALTDAEPTAEAAPTVNLDSNELAFDLPHDPSPAAEAPANPGSNAGEFDNNLVDLDLAFDMPDEAPAAAPPEPPTQAPAQAPSTDNMLDFDMADSLSLDLDHLTELDSGGLEDIPDGDPLETKLSLAAEFLAIGDEEGARSLAEEVVQEATGPLRAKASAFLSNLG